MNLGLRPSNFEFIYDASSLLKRDLLFFDQVHICSFNNVKVFDDLEAIDPIYNEKILREFDELRKYGLVCDFNLSEMVEYLVQSSEVLKGKANPIDAYDIKCIYESYKAIPKPTLVKSKSKQLTPQIIQKYKNDVDETENESTRISSVFLNRFASKDNATAIIQKSSPISLPHFHKANVLEVVLEKLPVPDSQVSWQQIVEYRADADSSAKFNALRVWLQDVSTKDYSKQEIEERIDHLINEYENHLNFHKLKFERSARHILLNSTLEILENLATFKFNEIGKKLFSFKERQFDLMEAELKAPGREVAYISKANDKF